MWRTELTKQLVLMLRQKYRRGTGVVPVQQMKHTGHGTQELSEGMHKASTILRTL